MSSRKRMLLLIGVMMAVCLTLAGVMITHLYRQEYKDERRHLKKTAENMALLTAAIARFEEIEGMENLPLSAKAALLSRLKTALKDSKGMGESEAYLIGGREGGSIVYLLRHGHGIPERPMHFCPVPDRCEPMRRALSGKSGTWIGPDDRGETVVTEYTPAEGVGLGVVVKKDLAEIRKPFVRIAAMAVSVTILMVFGGAMLSSCIGNPMVHQLEESEERFRTAFEKMPTGMSLVGLDGCFLKVNARICKMLSRSRGELEGLKVENTAFGKDVRAVLSRALASETNSDVFQTRSLDEQGHVTRFLHTYALIRNTKREPLYFILNTQDITVRKKKEKDLHLSEVRLNTAQRIARVGSWDRNLKTGEHYWSDEQYRIFGYEPGEVEPTLKFVKSHVHPDDLEAFLHIRENDFHGKEGYDHEFRIVRKDGDIRTVHGISTIEKDESGKAVRIFGTLQDITKRKQDEAALKEYGEKMEEMVDDRTREIKDAQKGLLHQAVEAGRAQLSAMVLHNIGNAMTPMSVFLEDLEQSDAEQILGYLEKCYRDLEDHRGDLDRYLLEDPRGREIFTYMGKLVDSLKQSDARKTTLVEKIKDTAAHISEIVSLQNTYAGKEEEVKVRADLNLLIRDAIAMQKLALEKRGITIKVDLKRKLPAVIIDRNRMMQVVVNLIKNGYEAIEMRNGDDGEKLISIRTFSEGGRFGFEIKDNGVGADPEQMKNGFEFGKSSKGSSGFGLYYCRMFVEANRGTLGFHSPGRGQGATVTVAFGPEVTEDPDHGDGPSETAAGTGDGEMGHGEKHPIAGH